MTKKNKSVKNFPNLRFPEFEGEWEKKMLGETFSIFNGYAFSSNASVDNGNLWVKIADVGIQEMKRDNISFLPFDFKEKYSKFILKKGDYVVALTRPILSGKLKIAKIDDFFNGSLLNQRVGKIQTNNHNGFIYYTLQRTPLIKEIENNIAGSDPPNLSPNEISSISIKLPVIYEQQKIADFLEIIDTRIQTQKKIIEGLQTLMKGNLETLFYQKIRFKNKQGNYFSDWKTIKLDEICDIKKGEQLNKEDLTETGNYPCLNGGMSFSGYTDKFNSNENTITISEGGNSCGFVSFMKSKFWLGGHCYKIILKKDISTDFFFHLLKFYEREIMNLRVGSGLPNIQQKDLKNLQLLVSQDIEEQTKIAIFLSSIQEKIEIEKQILEKLELQKKFLLANLFI